MLLATLFLAVLKKQQPPKAGVHPPVLTVVSSDIVYMTAIEQKSNTYLLTQFDEPNAYSPFNRYGISKLALLFFTCKLAETVSPDQVLINSVNPGMTAGTNFFQGQVLLMRKIAGFMQAMLARTTEVGATTYLDAVLSQGAKSHGCFLSDWQIKP